MLCIVLAITYEKFQALANKLPHIIKKIVPFFACAGSLVSSMASIFFQNTIDTGKAVNEYITLHSLPYNPNSAHNPHVVPGWNCGFYV